MLPFGGTFDLVQIKGSTLKKAFEHSVHRYGQSTGEFLQVGGKWHILRSMLPGTGLSWLVQPLTSVAGLTWVFSQPTPSVNDYGLLAS